MVRIKYYALKIKFAKRNDFKMENSSIDETPDDVGCVYELFNTSSGLIAVMDFPEVVRL